MKSNLNKTEYKKMFESSSMKILSSFIRSEKLIMNLTWLREIKQIDSAIKLGNPE